jgi:hypothetical protein
MAPRKHTKATAASATGGRGTLPAGRAFVVQLRADADMSRGVVQGRIEHIVSGAAALFDSAEQLIDWMRDAVARSTKSPADR